MPPCPDMGQSLASKAMKQLLLICAVVALVGCGKGKEAQTKTKVTKPVKELTLEEKVVGEYEFKNEIGLVRKDVYLANGNFEDYLDGEKQEEGKWKVVDGELHVEGETFVVLVSRINKDGSITDIAYIPKDGKRVDLPKEDQDTWKKIK